MTSSPPASKAMIFLRRGISTLALWGTVIAIFMSKQPIAYLALIAVLALGASWEYAKMMRMAGVKIHKHFFLTMSVLYVLLHSATFLNVYKTPMVFQFISSLRIWVDLGFLVLVSLGACCLQLKRPIEGVASLQSVALTVFGWLAIPFLFCFCSRVLFLPNDANSLIPSLPGAFLLLWLIAVTKFTDMGAYLTGSLFGKHKMVPHISPGKTWEGFAGALGFALLTGCCLYGFLPKSAGLSLLGNWGEVMGFSLVIAIGSIVGDLAESLVKRSLAIKDSGTLLPGIGGFYDLIDSLCFTAPILYFGIIGIPLVKFAMQLF